MKGLGEPSTVQPPWIAEENWFDAVTATPDTVRAALSSGDGTHLQKRASAIRLVNSFGRGLRASRVRHGWLIYIGPVNSRIDLCAVRTGSGHDGRRVRTSWLKQTFRPVGEALTSEEAEKLMIEFLSGPANPRSVAWIPLEWR